MEKWERREWYEANVFVYKPKRVFLEAIAKTLDKQGTTLKFCFGDQNQSL